MPDFETDSLESKCVIAIDRFPTGEKVAQWVKTDWEHCVGFIFILSNENYSS